MIYTHRQLDYKKYRKLRGTLYAFEGSVGTGKSTLGWSLEKKLQDSGLKAKYYPEYRNDLLLDQYLKNMKRYAYTFQMFMLMKRLEIYRDAYKFSLKGGIAIIDRSLLGDRTFARMLHRMKYITDEDWEIYNNVLMSEAYPEPDCILYLDCKPEKSYSRMISRGIESETTSYTLDYFQSLNEAYMESIEETSHPVHIIDWNDDQELLVENGKKYLTNEIICRVLDQIASLI